MKKIHYWPIIILVAIGSASLIYALFVPEAQAPSVAEPLLVSDTGDKSATKEANDLLRTSEVALAPAKSTKTVVTKKPMSYEEALRKYEKTRIQFDSECSAIPNTATYIDGTEIMFDNRAPVVRSVVFNLKTYKLPAYGYIIVKATNPTLPAITYIDCDTKQNVATITVQ